MGVLAASVRHGASTHAMNELGGQEPREPVEQRLRPTEEAADLHERFAREWSLYEGYVRKQIEIWVSVAERSRVDEPCRYVACFDAAGWLRAAMLNDRRKPRVGQYATPGSSHHRRDDNDVLLVHDVEIVDEREVLAVVQSAVRLHPPR